MEQNILLWIQDNLRNDVLTPFFVVITSLGNAGILWILITAGLLIPKKTRKVGILCVAALLFSFLIDNVLLKNLVARTRPYEVINLPGEKAGGLFLPLRAHRNLLCHSGGVIPQFPEKVQLLVSGAGSSHWLFQTLCGGSLPHGCAGGSYHWHADCGLCVPCGNESPE